MNLVPGKQVLHHFQQFDADVTAPDHPKGFCRKIPEEQKCREKKLACQLRRVTVRKAYVHQRHSNRVAQSSVTLDYRHIEL
jgi:hypothetical protein